MYFDAHCHLTDPRLAGDLAGVLARARIAGVTRMVTIASDADDADLAAGWAREYAGLWATAGIHPHAAGQATESDRSRVATLATRPEVVAIGETGLDFYYDNAPRPVQRALFTWHLQLASELGRPVVVHSREANEDTIAAIRGAAGVRGVLHCFSGSQALLEAGLEADWYISFAGMVTFRRFDGADLLRAVPGHRLLIETDSPYLAPVPHRGRTNEPALVPFIAEAVARLRDEPLEEIRRSTWRNACAFYGLES